MARIMLHNLQTGTSWLYIRSLHVYYRQWHKKKKKDNYSQKNPQLVVEIRSYFTGVADATSSSLPVAEALMDSMRIACHQLHLSYLLQSVKSVRHLIKTIKLFFSVNSLHFVLQILA